MTNTELNRQATRAELNRRAAEVVMGWELADFCAEDYGNLEYGPVEVVTLRYWYVEDQPVFYHDEHGGYYTDSHGPGWNPTEDLNQVHTYLLPKVAEAGKQEIFQTVLAQTALGNRYTKDNPVYGERLMSLNSEWLWLMLTATPETLTQVIVELFENHKAEEK